MRGALEGRGIVPRIVFLEARDDVLIRRFSETRHRHPLNDQRGIASSIAEERLLLDPRARARRTSSSTPPTCRCASCASGCSPSWRRRARPDQLAVQLISFGYKFGLPLEADLVFDVRFIAEPVLRPGPAAAVRADRRGPRLRPRPAGHDPLPRPAPGVPRFRDPGLHRRGQDPADDRHRLHRRATTAASSSPRMLAAWLREQDTGPGGRLPPRARPVVRRGPAREPAPLADRRGSGSSAGCWSVFLGLLCWPSASPTCSASCRATWIRAGRRRAHRRRARSSSCRTRCAA